MKRILSVAALGVLSSLAVVSGAVAESAKIEGAGPFTCHSADGDLLEPKYAFIGGYGSYFNLPEHREDCYAAVDRGIALCKENTRFEAEHDNRKYPGCLPIFEKRSRECVVSFQEQRVKCDAGEDSTTAETGGDSTTAETGANAECAAAMKRYEELAKQYLAILKQLERNYTNENVKIANELAKEAQTAADILSDC